MYLGAHLPLIISDVDGSGLSSLWSVVLEHKMKQNLLIQNEITPENNMYYMYSPQAIITKCFYLNYKGK